jgi:hypothetical protein
LADVGGGFSGDGVHASDGFVLTGEPGLGGGAVGVEEDGVGEEAGAGLFKEGLEFGGGGITGEDDLAIAEGFEVEGEGEDGDGGGGVFEGLAEEAEELACLGGPGLAVEHFAKAEEVKGGE